MIRVLIATALLLLRQNLPYAPKAGLEDISKGAYVLAEATEVGLDRGPAAWCAE